MAGRRGRAMTLETAAERRHRVRTAQAKRLIIYTQGEREQQDKKRESAKARVRDEEAR